MKSPKFPKNEQKRLEALCNLNILDTEPEERFDRITEIAKLHYQVPIALISIVDENRQWFKSRQGLDANETSRDISFCGHTILADDIFYISNALEDERFFDNPLVTSDPNIRFYAGAPLKSPEGERIGTLCIIDDNVHELSSDDFVVLRNLADCVESELARTELLKTDKINQQFKKTLDQTLDCIFMFEPDSLKFIYVNRGAMEQLGYSFEELTQMTPVDIKPQYNKKQFKEMLSPLIKREKQLLSFDTIHLRKDKKEIPVCILLQYIILEDDISCFVAIVRDMTESLQSQKALQESEARTRSILDTVEDSIITINDKGIIEDCNPATGKMFGYKVNELHGINIKLLMPEHYRQHHDEYINRYLQTRQAQIIGKGREVVGLKKDGSTFPMELAVNHINVNGRDLFTGVVRDITEIKINAEQLNALNADLSEKLRQLAKMNEVNTLLNEMGTFFQLSETKEEIYKVLRKYCIKVFEIEAGAYYQVIGKNLLEQAMQWGAPKSEQDFFTNHCWALRKGELYQVTDVEEQMLCNHLEPATHKDKLDYTLCVPVSGRDGYIGLLSIYGRKEASSDELFDDPIYQVDSQRFERNKLILKDVAERFGTAVANITLRQKLHLESTIDPLTKLYNRRYFEEASELELRRVSRNDKSLSILMLDADHFKGFNDEYGHDAGDYVLKTIADILKEYSRQEDIPTRLGGEEFAILFSMTPSDKTIEIAEKIRMAIENTALIYDDKNLRKMTISCGISSIPQHAETISECLNKADIALYEAKESGRNKVVCFKSRAC